MADDFDVIIIGAGAAGVGAARRLCGSGLSIAVLEAANRVGGRAWTVDLAGLPLDLGCGWLHSADRNTWTRIAEETGFLVDRSTSVWTSQYKDLGFAPADQVAARGAFSDWLDRMSADAFGTDNAGDLLEAEGAWNDFIRTRVGYISGAAPERMSVADYRAYDRAATKANWRVTAGYGALVAASLPPTVPIYLATPVEAIAVEPNRVAVETPRGRLKATRLIATISTAVLSGGHIRLPSALAPWQAAAADLPLGRDEKLFLQITADGSPFERETHVMGSPRDRRSGGYYIRPMGRQVIECFFGDRGAELMCDGGPVAAFEHAIDEITRLFGSKVRAMLRPLVASDWSRTTHVGGAYSYARPGRSASRAALAQPFEDRIFFAGEATSPNDFSTAHGAHDSGVRAAEAVLRAAATR